MTDHETEEQPQQDTGAANDPPSEDPQENTAPPSNPEVDQERLESEQEDLDRTVPS